MGRQALAATGKIRIEGAFTELVEDADFDREQAARLRALQADARAKGVAIGHFTPRRPTR